MAVVEEQSFADIGVTHAEESFVNPRQFTIYTQSWIPANPVYVGTKSAQNWRTVFVLYANVMKLFGIWPPVDRATLILVHGLGEHSNRYLHFVRHLVQNSIAVYALDHEAHGKSQGEKEFVGKVQHLVDDVITYARSVHAKHPELKRLLFGHSLGGCVALSVCLQQPDLFQYGIFSGPTTSRPPSVNAVLKALGGVVGSLGPKLRLTPLDTSTLCRDPEIVRAYNADPLVWHQNIAAGFGSDILSHGDKILDKAGTFITPSLFLTGSGDQIVSVAGVLKFYQHCSSQDKTYITLDGWYHELLNEPLNLMLMPLITDWLKPRLALADGEIIQTNVHSIATDPVQGSPDQRLRIAPVNNA